MRPRAASSTRSTAATCRRLSRSLGFRSRRSTCPASAARARRTDGAASRARRPAALTASTGRWRARSPGRRAGRGASCRPTTRTGAAASRGAPACRRRPARRSRSARDPRAAGSASPTRPRGAVSSASSTANSASGRGGAQAARRGTSCVRQSQRSRRPCWAIESPQLAALAEPFDEAVVAVPEGMQVRRRDDEQRRAVDAVIVQPVAHEGHALEGRRLHVVDRDRDLRAGDHAAARSMTGTVSSAAVRPCSSASAGRCCGCTSRSSGAP